MKTSYSSASISFAKGVVGMMLLTWSLAFNAQAATYYSQGNVDPGLTSSWNELRLGGGLSPADFSLGDTFVIQDTHNMGTTAAWTVSGAGNKIQIESGGTLTANNIVITSTFQVDNGGTYVHNAASAASNGATTDVPGTTRTFGATSIIEYQKWANGGATPVVLPTGPYGHLKINIALLAGSINMVGTLTTINGNLVIAATGGTVREFRLTGAATYALNVAGDIQVSGGILNLGSGAGVPTVNVTGQLLVTGGSVRSSGSGVPVFTVNGNSGKFAVSGGGSVFLSADLTNPPGAPVADSITLDNGILGDDGVNLTLSANRGITLGAGGGTLSMVQNRTMTIPGNITGPGGLTKSYGFGALAGTTVNLTLSGTNDFSGDFTILGGGVRFNSDTSAGKGKVIVSMPVGGVANATLRNLGVALSTLTNEVVFNANNGLIITLDSDVPNTFAMSGNFSGTGAVVHGANTGGTVVLSGDNSAWSGGLTARRGTLRLNHKNALGSGQYVVAPTGAAGAMAVSLQAGVPLTGVNAITNSVQFAITNIPLVLTSSWFTVSGNNDIELAGPISLGISGSSSPVITNLNTGATILSGVISGVGFGFTKVGTGTLTISNGANGFDGGTVINEGAVKIVNGSGSALGSGSVTIGANGTLTGNGSASGTVAVSGTVSPGSSVGTLGSGAETWAGGGHYVFEINQAAGTAGASPGWDKLNITGGLNITATSGSKFNIDITSLTLANAPGAVSDFNNANNYSWVIASTTTGFTGFDTNAFALNTAGFVNSLGSGSFSLSTNGNDLVLNFTGASAAQPPTSFVTTAAGRGTFSGSPNTGYTVQYADVLASPTVWLTLTNVVTDGSGVGAFNDASAPGGQPQRFYRVKNP